MAQAASCRRRTYFLDQSAIGPGYRAAPQLFYFAAKKKWLLVYQTGLPSYSTTDDPTKPQSWSAPKNFQDQMPDVVAQNIGNGYWVDFWVVCDKAMCYLFSSDDDGHLYLEVGHCGAGSNEPVGTQRRRFEVGLRSAHHSSTNAASLGPR